MIFFNFYGKIGSRLQIWQKKARNRVGNPAYNDFLKWIFFYLLAAHLSRLRWYLGHHFVFLKKLIKHL